MKELTFFYLRGCPYCAKAERYIALLTEKHPELARVVINRIEERDNAALADKYDYYYVPSFWLGNEKLHEGDPTELAVRNALTRALNAPEA